jgi:hypothetical protein
MKGSASSDLSYFNQIDSHRPSLKPPFVQSRRAPHDSALTPVIDGFLYSGRNNEYQTMHAPANEPMS